MTETNLHVRNSTIIRIDQELGHMADDGAVHIGYLGAEQVTER